jgi:hypothetical protein
MTRSQRRSLLAAAAVLLAAAALLPSAAAAAAAPTCKPKGSVGIAITATVRVYTLENEKQGTETLYACNLKDRKPLQIAQRLPDSEFVFKNWDTDLLRIAGNFVAIPVFTEDPDTEAETPSAVVADLKARKVGGKIVSGQRSGQISDLVLDAKGNAASETEVVEPGTKTVFERRIDRYSIKTNKQSLVSSSLSIAPKSLALSSGGTLFWLDSNVAKSAPHVP